MAATRRILRSKNRFGIKGLSEARRTRQAIAAISAISLLASPSSALASIIDANGKTLDTSTVTNIYAQKVLDKNGFNRFQEFKLDAGKIANLYFRTSGLTRRVDNLYNLVDSRIDINGTVNAIKNNNLGGNLYFLSKEGMVVGASGVINAGSLTVATPTDKYFTTMYAAAGSSNTGALSTLMKDITNNGITTIPINESGTISVLGKVNATDGITMRAAKVAVGKNVSGETVYGTAAAISSSRPTTTITKTTRMPSTRYTLLIPRVSTPS